jgi:HEAT repeat protein
MTAGCVVAPVPPPDPQLREIATTVVKRALRYPEYPAVRAQAMEAASETLGSEASLAIRAGLHDESPGVRFAACLALGKLRDRTAAAEIHRLAGDPDPNVRVAAYFALERMGDTTYREAWRDELRKSKDAAVRRNAVLALGELEDKSVMPLLHRVAYDDSDEGVRLQALEALAYLGDEDAINRFLFDAYGALGFKQSFALLTLGKVADNRVLATLHDRLRQAEHIETRLAAARGLARRGYDDGYDAAVAALRWNNPDRNASREPPDPPANQIMRVRTMAAMALGQMGDRRALGALTQMMKTDDDPRVQLAGATAILMVLNEAPGDLARGNGS